MTEVTIKVSANFCSFQIPAIAYRMLIFDNFLQKHFFTMSNACITCIVWYTSLMQHQSPTSKKLAFLKYKCICKHMIYLIEVYHCL